MDFEHYMRACDSCRNRKVKCSRLKPRCEQCIRHNYKCTRDNPIAKRGPKPKPTQKLYCSDPNDLNLPITDYHQLNLTLTNFRAENSEIINDSESNLNGLVGERYEIDLRSNLNGSQSKEVIDTLANYGQFHSKLSKYKKDSIETDKDSKSKELHFVYLEKDNFNGKIKKESKVSKKRKNIKEALNKFYVEPNPYLR